MGKKTPKGRLGNKVGKKSWHLRSPQESFTKIYPDMGPPAKLSYRSAIHKKVVFGAGDAWTLPQIQGEVGGDQEPPGNTSQPSVVVLNKTTAPSH